ncbi:MAG TPA: glycerate kinase [Chryseosolibacter sp.]|nr:glycerate kinase [Chryseosolibacter sp.]
MKILIAPNTFKNALPAREVAEAISHGLRSSSLQAEHILFPVGDGGDGTAKLLADHLDAKPFYFDVKDPLDRIVQAPVYVADDLAIIEMADASGLRLLSREEYDPIRATSFGTGQLIIHALGRGVKNILVCIGGSATVDGGVGALQAMGVKFLDRSRNAITELPQRVDAVRSADVESLHPGLRDCKIIILCDVQNPLTGENGAARIFGPQKGADSFTVSVLEKRLEHLARLISSAGMADISTMKFGGAAGGISALTHAVAGAKLVNGIDYFLKVTSFDEAVQCADWVITGEGSLDLQTLQGKAPFGVLTAARKYKKPVIGIGGVIPNADREVLAKHFDLLFPIHEESTRVDNHVLHKTKWDLIEVGRTIGDHLCRIKSASQRG